ncbi:carboxymuconolactone decarboxylase family protein [Kitasatospora sp. NPDC101447]|uniref:carboxymuconolactone decarboxylase family protein n=1 Tax=unclassified Kitasatospora TaxID=2633591 RepID=UPI0037C543F8
MTYQQPSDLRTVPTVRALARDEFDAFIHFHESVFREGGTIPLKLRELVALAVAMTTRCSYCIDTHTRGATDAGATREEIAEIGFVAAAVCAGGAMAHALLALRLDREHHHPGKDASE